jgi:hypothetical protein
VAGGGWRWIAFPRARLRRGILAIGPHPRAYVSSHHCPAPPRQASPRLREVPEIEIGTGPRPRSDDGWASHGGAGRWAFHFVDLSTTRSPNGGTAGGLGMCRRCADRASSMLGPANAASSRLLRQSDLDSGLYAWCPWTGRTRCGGHYPVWATGNPASSRAVASSYPPARGRTTGLCRLICGSESTSASVRSRSTWNPTCDSGWRRRLVGAPHPGRADSAVLSP